MSAMTCRALFFGSPAAGVPVFKLGLISSFKKQVNVMVSESVNE